MVSEDEHYEGSQFEINRGDLKQVFTKKQFYHDIKDLPERLGDMTFAKYGLKKWSAFKDSLKAVKLDQSITKANVKELFKKVKAKDYMSFEDYLGRKLIMDEKVFKAHTSGKYLNKNEQRHRLFPHIENVIKNPDEVWLSKYERKDEFQTYYVKFYKDDVIIVNTSIDQTKEGLTIKSWFPLKIDEEKLRTGILIKKGKDL